MKTLLLLTTVLLLTGCGDQRYDSISNQQGFDNVRKVSDGYIMYEIENGSVTCREHRRRAELACWKN